MTLVNKARLVNYTTVDTHSDNHSDTPTHIHTYMHNIHVLIHIQTYKHADTHHTIFVESTHNCRHT